MLLPTIRLRDRSSQTRGGSVELSDYVLPEPVETDPERSFSIQMLSLLEKHAPVHTTIDAPLRRAILATLSNPGSLMRAELACRSADAFGLHQSSGVLACAVEYFHVASLLFDDLPCMDDASLRRGRICAHLLYGEAVAILAALALITRAYGLAGAVIGGAPDPGMRSGAQSLIEECLGTTGMLNGQAQDLHYRTHDGGKAVRAIALIKTVPMLRLALELPAVVAGAEYKTLRLLRRLAIYWGLYYQASDDLADMTMSAEATGKSPAQDVRLQRPNAVQELGPDGALLYLRRLSELAQACAERLTDGNPRLGFLLDYHELLRARLDEFPAPPRS